MLNTLQSEALNAMSPCDGCRYESKCSEKNLACERLTMFSRGLKRNRWINAPMAPTTARLAAIVEWRVRRSAPNSAAAE